MIKGLTLAASLAFRASAAVAEPTRVMVRARAHDAKFCFRPRRGSKR